MGSKPPTTLHDTYIYTCQKCCRPTRHLDGQSGRWSSKNSEPTNKLHRTRPLATRGNAATISSCYENIEDRSVPFISSETKVKKSLRKAEFINKRCLTLTVVAGHFLCCRWRSNQTGTGLVQLIYVVEQLSYTLLLLQQSPWTFG